MRTLTGLSGEYVTFDQNVKKCKVRIRNFVVTSERENWPF